MKIMMQIAFRNLLRQKRRNILLGIAMAFGILVLTVANSFSKGLTENLLNKIIVTVAGHIQVKVYENGRYMTPVIRDRERFLKLVKETVPEVLDIQEDLGTMARAIGNGKADYVFIVGIDPNASNFSEFFSQFPLIQGSIEDFTRDSTAYPLILAEKKAKTLQVKVGDQVRIRFSNVNGQNDTGLLTVVGIAKSQNMYMDYAIFTKLNSLKTLLGYRPYETGSLRLVVENPKKTAITITDKLHDAFKADYAYIAGHAQFQSVLVTPFSRTVSSNVLNQLAVFAPNPDLSQKGIYISQTLAKRLGKQANDRLIITYPTRYAQALGHFDAKILGIYAPKTADIPDHLVWMQFNEFFKYYNYQLPKTNSALAQQLSLSADHTLFETIALEWRLLHRTHNTKEFTKKLKDLFAYKYNQPLVDAASMYESASQIVQMEAVFNLVTFLVGSVLFFIIMIGVLNSLRMTVRERTREIGTLRAIGMKRNEVRNVFILEVLFLIIISWLAGTILAMGLMKLLALYQFGPDNALNMIMFDRRLFFVTTPGNMIANLILVMVFGLVTAYFPARSAAKLKPAEALRQN